jgi:hypothetical protein
MNDNTKVGVFAYAKDFSATLEMTEGGKSLKMRRYAPRSFDYAQDDKVEWLELRV